jgi:hypothetical protein
MLPSVAEIIFGHVPMQMRLAAMLAKLRASAIEDKNGFR